MHRIIIRSVGSNAAIIRYKGKAEVRSQGDLARPYADFPNGEDTPYPPSPSWSPEPLWSPSREGTDTLIGPAHPVLSQKPGKQARKVAVFSEARQEAAD